MSSQTNTTATPNSQQSAIHGVLLDVLGMGVLLTGRSGIGKSELALGLINRGHRLVADDAPVFERTGEGNIIGSCPDLLQDFLEVRGLGILNIRALFGDTAIKTRKRLQLIVKIIEIDHKSIQQIDRLHGIHRKRRVLDVEIPEVTIPVAPGRHLPVLVEGAVRNQVLKSTGYEASAEFIKRQKQIMESNKTCD